jgi:hypothetical protein
MCITVYDVRSLDRQVSQYPIRTANTLMEGIQPTCSEPIMTIISGVITEQTAEQMCSLYPPILQDACKNGTLLVLALYCPVCISTLMHTATLLSKMKEIPGIVIKYGPSVGQWPHQYVRAHS